MSYIMVDIESDGPIPGDYSMICFGAVVVGETFERTFYGELKPVSDKFIPEALNVSGFTREQTLSFDDPKVVMEKFEKWINNNSKDRPIFISDNNGFDWMFICWYFHHFLQKNPFGFSSMNLGSFYKGVIGNTFENFKHLRKTKHTHNPLDDAIGNAEAFLSIIKSNDIKIKL